MTNQIPRGEDASWPALRRIGGTADASAVSPIPPGSTALREFCHAVIRALTLPDPARGHGISAGPEHELTHLRLSHDRARITVQTMHRILADREIDDRVIMNFVVSLREELAGDSADRGHHPGGSS